MSSDSRTPAAAQVRQHLLVVVDRFPVISETFIQHEIRELHEQGHPVTVLSCSPRELSDHVVVGETLAVVKYGPPLRVASVVSRVATEFACHPLRVAGLLSQALRYVWWDLRGIWRAVSGLAIALALAKELGEGESWHIHAHFLRRPTLVAALLARMTDSMYSVAAHGRDVFVPDFRISALCRDSVLIVACSQFVQDDLARRLDSSDARKVVCCYHGVPKNLSQQPSSRPARTSRCCNLLSVGRLVAKKGLDTTLRAAAILKERGVCIQYRIVGNGPELSRLQELTSHLGLAKVEFLGALSGWQVIQEYTKADLFLLGCRVTEDGDRDGIPNVILESMAMGVPVLATSVGGIPEVVSDGLTGLIVPPDDATAMADSIEHLLDNEDLRLDLVRRARRQIDGRFDLRQNVQRKMALLQPARDDVCDP